MTDYQLPVRHYLSPEPMLQDPNWVKDEAAAGVTAPTYAYARNNPLRFTDPTGLEPPRPGSNYGEGCHQGMQSDQCTPPDRCTPHRISVGTNVAVGMTVGKAYGWCDRNGHRANYVIYWTEPGSGHWTIDCYTCIIPTVFEPAPPAPWACEAP